MIKIFKQKQPDKTSNDNTPDGLFRRLRSGLSKTRHNLTDGLTSIVLGKKTIDDELLEEIETHLLSADLGVSVTQALLSDLMKRLNRKQLKDSNELIAALKEDMVNLLKPVSKPLQIDEQKKPFVILTVGVNGSGKTTTIGKLAKHLQQEGKNVILAAGDTFRAAAIEQLQVWGERNNIPVVAQQTGSDSASVIFDALQSAKAKDYDVLIADTAGRLHTQDHLIEELKKILRVIRKLDDTAPHEVMLVLDATIGQNAIQQAKQFHQAANISSIAITKLDGSAKGGVIFAIAKALNIPIHFIGVGEQIDDLQIFDAENFVEALFAS